VDLSPQQLVAVKAVLPLLLQSENVPEEVLRYAANCELGGTGLPSYNVPLEDENSILEIARQIVAGNFE
jgi:hypothetical protein